MNIKEALESAMETRALLIGPHILDQVPSLFRETFPGKEAILVADVTTWKVAGEKVQMHLERAGIDCHSPFVFAESRPYAEYGNVEKLVQALKASQAIPVVVGSGTLNDLTKLASALTDRPYMCVATAASMDGYTAFGASITYQGAKQTFSCPAPAAVLGDIEIIRNAPSAMTASGYADLFAKITAGADWIVADALGLEPIDAKAWAIVQDGLKEALADPLGAKEGMESAITPLVEGLILGGFAMQWSKTSRPASGAEHQFSHLWNMEHHTHLGETPSHGFQVGIATLAVTRLYEKLLQTPLENLDVEACCRQWPEWSELEIKIDQIFGKSDFRDTALKQSRDKYVTREELALQLEKLRHIWPGLKNRLTDQLVPSDEVRKRLTAVGAPTDPEEIGITRERMKDSFLRAWFIRSRFTVLDLAVRTGYLEQWLDELYIR
jgi:glycerol-1-phosphate dehydrogenase [NAD(P)+]